MPTLMPPSRSIETVALAIAPFFGPALLRCCGVSTVLMYPIFEIEGSTTAAQPIPYNLPAARDAF